MISDTVAHHAECFTGPTNFSVCRNPFLVSTFCFFGQVSLLLDAERPPDGVRGAAASPGQACRRSSRASEVCRHSNLMGIPVYACHFTCRIAQCHELFYRPKTSAEIWTNTEEAEGNVRQTVASLKINEICWTSIFNVSCFLGMAFPAQ